MAFDELGDGIARPTDLEAEDLEGDGAAAADLGVIAGDSTD